MLIERKHPHCQLAFTFLVNGFALYSSRKAYRGSTVGGLPAHRGRRTYVRIDVHGHEGKRVVEADEDASTTEITGASGDVPVRTGRQ
jgi:hypothetical protein